MPNSSLVAPVNDSRASASPEMTSGATPSTSTTRSVNSWEFAASLVALVATIRIASGAAASMRSAYSRSAVIVRSRAASDSRPVRSTPSPSRTIRISRATSVRGAEPVSGTNGPFDIVFGL